MTTDELAGISNLFQILAEIDYRGASPLYERLARESAEDEEILALLLPAAAGDRIPHLLLAATQYLLWADNRDILEAFATEPFATFRSWALDHRRQIEAIVAARVVQTNEVGRCSALSPTLATVAQWAGSPLAVIEVGASAGLNLLFDRYRYVYGEGVAVGPESSGLVLRPRIESDLVPPLTLPEVAWRRGIDRQPVDVMDDDAVRWLKACIWPEQRWRTELLERAVTMARLDPPTVVAGDVYETLPEVVATVPEGSALCVMHTAVAGYLPDRGRFSELLRELAAERPLWWVSGEAPGLVPEVPLPASPPRDGIYFVYGVVPLGTSGGTGGTSGRPAVALARAGAHGAWLEWFGPAALKD